METSNEIYINLLMIPMKPLYDKESLDEISLNKRTAEYLKEGYPLIDRKHIYKALKWVELNPDFDFKGLLKESSFIGVLNFTNEEIYQYLMKFKVYMEDDNFGLINQ